MGDEYIDISKHSTDTGKMDLAQITFIPKDNIKRKSHTNYSSNNTLGLENNRCTKNRASYDLLPQIFITIIIVQKKKVSSSQEVIYRMVVDFRMINEQTKYWSYPLTRIDIIISKCNSTKFFSALNI